MQPFHSRRPHNRPQQRQGSFNNGRNSQPPYRSVQRTVSEDEARFLSGTPIDPSPRIRLENGSSELTMRAMDLICPIGYGQRGLIVAPPGSGKTTFLKHLCLAVTKACPEMKIYCLLVDERPEEVTDFKRGVTAEVFASSIDQGYDHHVRTAEDVMKKAFQTAGSGGHVMVLIDSLTRLARVHNAEQRSSGRTISGGLDARALEVPRRIFGAARRIENAGSLAILATILVETGSRMDDVIFEEFKGTGNMEIVLSRELSNRRIFPAIDIAKSATRRMENLLAPDELKPVEMIRRVLAGRNTIEAGQALLEQLQKYPSNKQLLEAVSRISDSPLKA